MNEIGGAFRISADMVARLDPEVIGIVLLSLRVSLTASVVAFVLGTPLGAWLAITRLPGRAVLLVLANATLGLPPVVIGLVVYLTLSRSGPLGPAGLLFTPTAMMIAQSMLALTIVVALTHRVVERLWADFGEALVMDGASQPRAVVTLLAAGRTGLVTVFLSAFGRVIAEVGAILVVGGNIRGFTRTMTTAIALETSAGDLPLALALGLILILLSIAVSAAAFMIGAVLDRASKPGAIKAVRHSERTAARR
jgi:tungstate transport system permease protein